MDRTALAYDTVAAAYERQFTDELDAKPRDRELLDELAAHGSGCVIDVGCGPGQIGAYVARSGRPVLGIDLSTAMATLAARRLTAAAAANVLDLPLPDGAVDDAVACYSVIHLPRSSLAPALTELARVLRPGGWLLLSAHEGTGETRVTSFLGHQVELDATFFTLAELTTAATASGFEIVTAERRPPYENEGSTTRLYVVAQRRSG